MFLVTHVQVRMSSSTSLEKDVEVLSFACAAPAVASFQHGPLVAQPLPCYASLKGEGSCVVGRCRRVTVVMEPPLSGLSGWKILVHLYQNGRAGMQRMSNICEDKGGTRNKRKPNSPLAWMVLQENVRGFSGLTSELLLSFTQELTDSCLIWFPFPGIKSGQGFGVFLHFSHGVLARDRMYKES